MRRLLIFSVVLLSACGSIHPRIGMTFEELNRQAGGVQRGGVGCGGLEMVVGKGDISVYRVRFPSHGRCSPNIFYYFRDDKLVEIDQGQLYEQRYRIDINR